MHNILFCENPTESGKVDPDFEDEMDAAKTNGFNTFLFHFDDFVYSGNTIASTKKITAATTLTPMIYRGWMLTPQQYTTLYNTLLAKNYRLINDPLAYTTCHYLPENLPFIQAYTPETVFEKLDATQNLQPILEKAKQFGNRPVIIKDYVKSEKHDWDTACFVPDASDTEKLTSTIQNFLTLRGKYLNEGIVIRAFETLNMLTTHTKSGMPLAEEYRLFFFQNQLLGIYDYWEEGEYQTEKPVTSLFENLSSHIPSAFFSMDIARKKNGEWIIVELGDGQVSGLPERTNKKEFYSMLKTHISKI